jgi:hypothetical protein
MGLESVTPAGTTSIICCRIDEHTLLNVAELVIEEIVALSSASNIRRSELKVVAVPTTRRSELVPPMYSDAIFASNPLGVESKLCVPLKAICGNVDSCTWPNVCPHATRDII